jgi:hypothetical protein
VLYHSGEEIRLGDHIRYHGDSGYVQFLATVGDSPNGWYVETYGPGCMIVADGFGAVYVTDSHTDEDLEFVARGEL